MKTYFNLDEKLKKIFNYFSIFTIVLGTTFGSINSANAAPLAVTASDVLSTAGGDATAAAFAASDGDITLDDGDDTNAAAIEITINTSDGATDGDDLTTTATVGAITEGADDTGSVLILTTAAVDEAIRGTVGTITISGNFEAKQVDTTNSDENGTGETQFTIGASTVGGTFKVTNLDATDDSNIMVIASGDLTVTGITTIAGVDDGNAILNLDADATFKTAGGVVLNDATGLAILEVSGGTTQTIAGEVDGAAAGEGTIKVTNSSTATFNNLLGEQNKLLEFEIGSGSTATTTLLLDTTTLDVDGTLIVSENANIASAGTGIDLEDGSVLRVAKTVTDGETVFDTTNLDASGLDAGAKIFMPTNLSNGQTLVLFDDMDGDDGADEVNAILQDTALINYVAADTGETVTITANDKTESATSTALSITSNEAKALKQAWTASISDANTDSDAEDAFNNALNALGGFSATEDTNLTKQVAPQTDMISGSTFATKAMTGSVQGIISNRVAALRSGDAYYGSGMSAGSLSKNSGFIQVFGSDVEQKNKTVGSGTQFGYDASTAGIVLGFDGITNGGTVVGLSLSTSQSDVDGKGTGNSKNDIDSYTASIYMDKSTDAGYIEGSLTIGMNENSTSRIVNTAGLDRTYKGDYDSYQASLNLSGGVPNDTGNGFVTPFGGVSATQIQTERYRETSSTAGDNLRLTVDQDDVTSIVGTVGVKYHNVLDNGGVPMISLAINNEFGDNTIDSTNTYQGGGTSFKTSTDVEELSATLGLGFSMTSDNTTVEFSYEADANDDDYLSHYGSIKIVGKF
jgi:uncharacterized protein with beta-barrel porin domain